jgi:hypothetical protein
LRIRSLEQVTPVARRTFDPETGAVDVTMELRIDERHSISYMGVDPKTADRAGSLTEWYQTQGPDWFRERSDFELQQIAEKLEMGYTDKDGRPLERIHVLNKMIAFFFGHADARAA